MRQIGRLAENSATPYMHGYILSTELWPLEPEFVVPTITHTGESGSVLGHSPKQAPRNLHRCTHSLVIRAELPFGHSPSGQSHNRTGRGHTTPARGDHQKQASSCRGRNPSSRQIRVRGHNKKPPGSRRGDARAQGPAHQDETVRADRGRDKWRVPKLRNPPSSARLRAQHEAHERGGRNSQRRRDRPGKVAGSQSTRHRTSGTAQARKVRPGRAFRDA